MEKSTYENVEMEVTLFDSVDIITNSTEIIEDPDSYSSDY